MSDLRLNNDKNPFIMDSIKMLVDYVGGTNAIYIGRAAPGIGVDEHKWQVRKLTYDGNDNVTAVEFANGTASFCHPWSERTTFSYS